MLEEFGLDMRVARVSVEAWRVEMLAGDVVAAEHELRRGYEILEQMGERYLRSSVAGLLGQTLYALGRFEEAEALAEQAETLASPEDIDTQPLWRCLRAKMLARRGSFEEAEAYVREALEILGPTESVLLQHGALLDLAEVHRLAGRDDQARAALEEALRLADVKQSPVLGAAARGLLDSSDPESLLLQG
jgi:tetratricopeptide (TPR) repeat protein